MLEFVVSIVVIVAAVFLGHQFYTWVRRAQGTLDDDPFNEHFDWDEWAQSVADENEPDLPPDWKSDLPPAVKNYETAKKTRTRVRKTVAKKPSKKPVKKAVKRTTKKTARKKVTRG
jgi:hypothetical protein